jgi:hypothetical protein
MEPEGSLPHSQEPATCPYPEPTQSAFTYIIFLCHRSQWPRGLRRGSAAFRLVGLRVRIPPGARMCVCCECCVLSGRGLCVALITRPEESYRVWCAWVWSWSLDNEEELAHWGLLCHWKKIVGLCLRMTSWKSRNSKRYCLKIHIELTINSLYVNKYKRRNICICKYKEAL